MLDFPSTDALLFSGSNLSSGLPNWGTSSQRDICESVREVCTDVLAIQFLSPAYCRMLTTFLDDAADFHCNPNDAFAAPEIQLRNISLQIERSFEQAVIRHLAPIMSAKWTVLPASIHPPFIIRYSIDTQVSMKRHHDMHSDVSISINLNDEFQGGGLYFSRQNYCTNSLPVGTAVLFPGRVTHLHEALQITSGKRYVLTAWTEDKVP
jgi:predicted 2-oxoglutarate/Fe(II)-dependent dioxygenase YbiX